MGIMGRLRSAVMQRSRTRNIEDFYRYVPHECDVLDVGVSKVDHSPQENLFLKLFRFPEVRYTGLAVDTMVDLERQHPGKRFVVYDGRVFPFPDRHFGVVFSNAVIEHVGGWAEQILFINEMLRTGEKVFFTTPNKFFPIESHTNSILIHWFSRWFYAWCRRHDSFWSENNLRLLSHSELLSLMKHYSAKSFTIKRNRFFGLTMTFSVFCQS